MIGQIRDENCRLWQINLLDARFWEIIHTIFHVYIFRYRTLWKIALSKFMWDLCWNTYFRFSSSVLDTLTEWTESFWARSEKIPFNHFSEHTCLPKNCLKEVRLILCLVYSSMVSSWTILNLPNISNTESSTLVPNRNPVGHYRKQSSAWKWKRWFPSEKVAPR